MKENKQSIKRQNRRRQTRATATQKPVPKPKRETVKVAPVSVSRTNISTAPSYKGSKRGVCISHKEFIGNVYGSVGYTNNTYRIQPGVKRDFPWLANVAGNFEQYRIKRLEYRYITRASTSAVGSVLMSFDYDAADEAPVSELIQATYEDTVETNVWRDVIIRANPNSLHTPEAHKFVRGDFLPPGTDLRLYDCGFLIVGVTGTASAELIGKLWVVYEIEFYTPQLSTTTPSLWTCSMGSGSGGGVGPVTNLRDLSTLDPKNLYGNINVVPTVTSLPTSDSLSMEFSIPANPNYLYLFTMIGQWNSSSGTITEVNWTFNSTGGTPLAPLAYMADYTSLGGSTTSWADVRFVKSLSERIVITISDLTFSGSSGTTLWLPLYFSVIEFPPNTLTSPWTLAIDTLDKYAIKQRAKSLLSQKTATVKNLEQTKTLLESVPHTTLVDIEECPQGHCYSFDACRKDFVIEKPTKFSKK